MWQRFFFIQCSHSGQKCSPNSAKNQSPSPKPENFYLDLGQFSLGFKPKFRTTDSSKVKFRSGNRKKKKNRRGPKFFNICANLNPKSWIQYKVRKVRSKAERAFIFDARFSENKKKYFHHLIFTHLWKRMIEWIFENKNKNKSAVIAAQ